MRKEYDFSTARRGAIVSPRKGKTRVTIRLDDDILAWFKARVHKSGGGNYQTLINDALRAIIETPAERLETVIRRIVRQELGHTRRRKSRAA